MRASGSKISAPSSKTALASQRSAAGSQSDMSGKGGRVASAGASAGTAATTGVVRAIGAASQRPSQKSSGATVVPKIISSRGTTTPRSALASGAKNVPPRPSSSSSGAKSASSTSRKSESIGAGAGAGTRTVVVRGSPSSPNPKPPILVRTHFVIKGKVQGVYFRKFTQQKAVELGIFGTVFNEEDGSVTGEAEGRIEPMNDFKYWLQFTGSPKSKIESADFADEAGVEGRKYSRFDIIK